MTNAANLSVFRVLLFPIEHFWAFAAKLMTGTSDVLHGVIGVLGLVMAPFALVSMFYRFKIPSANAVRGFIYGAGALLVMGFALFSVDLHAVIILAPVVAVFGSAYFFLLLESRKLHPVYVQAVVGVVVLATLWSALGLAVWKSDLPEQSKALASTKIVNDSFDGMLYTDIPWAIAWRTNGLAIWLPCRDEDVYELRSKGLPLNFAILTSECESYASNDTWSLLHRFQFWRDYMKDPSGPAAKAQISTLANQPNLTLIDIERSVREMKRQLSVSESISGCTSERFRGLAPDEFILVTCPPK